NFSFSGNDDAINFIVFNRRKISSIFLTASSAAESAGARYRSGPTSARRTNVFARDEGNRIVLASMYASSQHSSGNRGASDLRTSEKCASLASTSAFVKTSTNCADDRCLTN